MNLQRQMDAARAASDLGRFEQSEPLLHRVLERDPRCTEALNLMAMGFQVQGRFAEAQDAFARSLSIDANQGLSVYAMVHGFRLNESDQPLIDQLETTLATGDLSPEDETYFHYSLGKAADDLGRYEMAMRHWDAGNAGARDRWFKDRKFEPDLLRGGVDWTINKFDATFLRKNAGGGSASEFPIFVVGMMRSGTTLVEQVLSAHPEVAAGEELPFWLSRGREAFDPVRGTISSAHAGRLCGEYLRLLRGLGPDAKRVTDKMPQNYMVLGVIHLLFPNARIVHVRRQPADNCLSIYSTYYQRPPEFALNKANIGFAYRQYSRMVAYWKSVIPADRLYDVEYERLILEPEKSIPELVEFCGLPWSEACLHPESNTRHVRTPSLWQVRQPLYKNSIGRAAHYRQWLPEFENL